MKESKIKDYMMVSESGAFYAKTSDILKQSKVQDTIEKLANSSIVKSINKRKVAQKAK